MKFSLCPLEQKICMLYGCEQILILQVEASVEELNCIRFTKDYKRVVDK